MNKSTHSMTSGFSDEKNPDNSTLNLQPQTNLMNSLTHSTTDISNGSSNIYTMNNNSSSNYTASALPTPIFRYDDEFGITVYDEDNDFPSYSPTFYEDSSDTVWIRPNSLECAYERDYAIRFNLDEKLPKDKELIVDYVEIVIYATGDHSNLTVELYLDNMLLTSIPYRHCQMTVFDLKNLHIDEKIRTLSYSKNIMVRFTQNGRPHLNMGIGCASPGLPAGHIRGRLKDRNKLLPKSTYHYLTDHNKNVTGLTDTEGNITATWDYDAFGNIIHQTGAQANQNPLRFSSEYHDEDLGLIYYNYRHYSPKEGRWISRDMASNGWDNLYAFVTSPLQNIDTLGLFVPNKETYDEIAKAREAVNKIEKQICNKDRKEKMNNLNQLVSQSNPNTPDCSKNSKCKSITLIIEVSNPRSCQTCIIPYGHAGIAFENTFYDSGPNLFFQLAPYWSADYPTLRDLELNVGTRSTGPVFEVKFCVCEKDFNDMQKKWKNMVFDRMSPSVGSTWGIAGTCSADVARTIGKSNNSFITPDDLLTDIAPSLMNSCGSERGKLANIKMINNPWGV